jgi:hypothetical protein
MVYGADSPNFSVEQYQGKDGTWCRLPQTLPGARQTEAPRAVKSNLNSGILFPPSPPKPPLSCPIKCKTTRWIPNPFPGSLFALCYSVSLYIFCCTVSWRIRIFNCIEEVPRFFFAIEFNFTFQISNYLQVNCTPDTI